MHRVELSDKGDFSNEMFKYAHQFAESDTVVIAAPYWDLSFPAVLKAYLEAVSVCGITFKYDEQGVPARALQRQKTDICYNLRRQHRRVQYGI